MNPFDDFNVALIAPAKGAEASPGNPFEDFGMPPRAKAEGLQLPEDPAQQDRVLKDVIDISAKAGLARTAVENNYEQFKGKPSPFVAAGLGGYSPYLSAADVKNAPATRTIQNSLDTINGSLALADAYLNGGGQAEALIQWQKANQAASDFYEQEKARGSRGPVEALILDNLAVAAPMVKSAVEAMPATVGGAVAGALIALGVGEVPPLTVLPEEIGTVPAGAIKGASVGFTAKSAVFWYRQGLGDMYGEMLSRGVDPKVAGPVASIAAIPYAAIEFSQISKLTPGLRTGVRQTLGRSISRVLSQAAVKYGETLTTETFEEMMQEAVAVGANDVADYLSGHGIELNREGFTKRISRITKAGMAAMRGMSLLPVPGAVQDIAAGIQQSVPSGATSTEMLDQIYDGRIEQAKAAGDSETADVLTAMKAGETEQISPKAEAELAEQDRHMAAIAKEGKKAEPEKPALSESMQRLKGEFETQQKDKAAEAVDFVFDEWAGLAGDQSAEALKQQEPEAVLEFLKKARGDIDARIKERTWLPEMAEMTSRVSAGLDQRIADLEQLSTQIQEIEQAKPAEAAPEAVEGKQGIVEPPKGGPRAPLSSQNIPNWQMTLDTFAKKENMLSDKGVPNLHAIGMHEMHIKGALREGTLSPSEALEIHKATYEDIETWPEYKQALAAQPEAAPEAVEGKQAWEMTREEWKESSELSEVYHRNALISAVGEGKPVPRNVLEEYKSEPWAQQALAAQPEAAKAEQSQIVPATQPTGKNRKSSIEDVPPQTRQLARDKAAKTGRNVYIRRGERKGAWYSRTTPPKSGDYFTITPEGQEIFGQVPAELPKPGVKKKGMRMMSGFDPGIDTFIAEDIKPAVAQAVEAAKATAAVGKMAGRMVMEILEPARATEKRVGKEAAVAVFKAIHKATDVARLEFSQQRLKAIDINIAALRKWSEQFSKEDHLNFIVAFAGQPGSADAAFIQNEAVKALPEALKAPQVLAAIREIAETNYRDLVDIVGPQVHWVPDYFYGVFKSADEVDTFWKYWTSTDRFTKHKNIPSVADAVLWGMEAGRMVRLRQDNYIDNLMAERMGIARLGAMKWLKNELIETGKGVLIDEFADAPADWADIKDPVFNGWRTPPDLAAMANKLISTNKISQNKVLNAVRQMNNFLRIVKFFGGLFHARVIIKATLADSGYLGFLYKKSAYRWLNPATRRSWEQIQQTPEYKRLLELGLGYRYSAEETAQKTFSGVIGSIDSGNYLGATGRLALTPLRLGRRFSEWMFEQWIPRVKYAKVMDAWAEIEQQKGRQATDWELINVIKETQNFYGEMNERLFGRSGTATSTLRFFFLAPGFAEGNYRTIIKSLTQWGFGEGWNASRSRANILNSGLITVIAASVGTLIMTGRPPKKPEKLEDIKDLFKIDTGRTDGQGRRVMIDLLDYDKDYFNVYYNLLRGRPDVAAVGSLKRLGGMKAPMLDIASDALQLALGRAIYDWKEDRVTEITDPWTEKLLKISLHEIKKLEPIPSSVFSQARAKQADAMVSFLESVSGFRPTMSEQDRRESQILKACWSLKGQQEETYQSLARIERPRQAVQWYNRRVKDILEGPLVPEEIREKWMQDLTIDLERYLQNQAHSASLQSRSDQGRYESERAVKVLKNFGIDAAEAQQLLRQYYSRTGGYRLQTPAEKLEAMPVVGRTLKQQRLKQRMLGEEK